MEFDLYDMCGVVVMATAEGRPFCVLLMQKDKKNNKLNLCPVISQSPAPKF